MGTTKKIDKPLYNPWVSRALYDRDVTALSIRASDAEDRLVRLIALWTGDETYLSNQYAGDWRAAADTILESVK